MTEQQQQQQQNLYELMEEALIDFSPTGFSDEKVALVNNFIKSSGQFPNNTNIKFFPDRRINDTTIQIHVSSKCWCPMRKQWGDSQIICQVHNDGTLKNPLYGRF